MTLKLTAGAIAATFLMALVPAGAASASTGTTSAERKLCVRASDDLGLSYVNDLKARRTTCRKAKKVVRGFAECRFKPAARGGCSPLGFTCRESDVTSSPFQRSAHVVCRRGAKKVVFDYTQNT